MPGKDPSARPVAHGRLKTVEQARDAAKVAAGPAKKKLEIWKHVGGDTPGGHVTARGTYIVREPGMPKPKWDCWELVETV